MAGKMALRKRICFACSEQFPEAPCEPVECPIIQVIKDIDPESLRPKGRWELHGNDDDCGCSYFCSNCHRSYPEEWFWDHGKYVPFENCPHCTAKMEG